MSNEKAMVISERPIADEVIVGFDQGFSSVKVYSDYGKFKIPNVVQEIQDSGVLLSLNNNASHKTYYYDNKLYLVGAAAKKNTVHFRSIEYLIKYAPLFLAVVFDELYRLGMPKSAKIIIAAGLPLEDVNYVKQYKMALENCVVNGIKYPVSQVILRSQGVAAFADYYYGWGRKDIQPGEEGFIWDIGENTMILIRYEDGQVLKDGSKQFNKAGISAIYDLLREPVRQRIDREPSIVELRNILSGKLINVFGQGISCSDLVKQSIANYLDKTYKEIMDKYSADFSRCHKVILVGGGSILLSKYISQTFRREGFFQVAPEPEYANVRGYREIYLAKMRNNS